MSNKTILDNKKNTLPHSVRIIIGAPFINNNFNFVKRNDYNNYIDKKAFSILLIDEMIIFHTYLLRKNG